MYRPSEGKCIDGHFDWVCELGLGTVIETIAVFRGSALTSLLCDDLHLALSPMAYTACTCSVDHDAMTTISVYCLQECF